MHLRQKLQGFKSSVNYRRLQRKAPIVPFSQGPYELFLQTPAAPTRFPTRLKEGNSGWDTPASKKHLETLGNNPTTYVSGSPGFD